MTYLNPDPQIVDGVDVDVVAAAVRSCPGVDDLDAGALGSVTSYLPGRKVFGVKVEAGTITVQVRSRWGVPIPSVAEQIRTAVGPVAAGRSLQITVSDVADPPSSAPGSLPTLPPSAGTNQLG